MTENDGKKDGFEWKEGQTLDDAIFSPLGDIRGHGLPKINKAIAKDPSVRKQERERFLAGQQSQPYKTKTQDKDEQIIIEGKASDLSGEFEDSEVKRLTDKGNQNKGFNRFGKK